MKKICKIALGVGVGIVVGPAIACLIKKAKKRCEGLDYEMFEESDDEDFDDFFEEEDYLENTSKKNEEVNENLEEKTETLDASILEDEALPSSDNTVTQETV